MARPMHPRTAMDGLGLDVEARTSGRTVYLLRQTMRLARGVVMFESDNRDEARQRDELQLADGGGVWLMDKAWYPERQVRSPPRIRDPRKLPARVNQTPM